MNRSPIHRRFRRGTCRRSRGGMSRSCCRATAATSCSAATITTCRIRASRRSTGWRRRDCAAVAALVWPLLPHGVTGKNFLRRVAQRRARPLSRSDRDTSSADEKRCALSPDVRGGASAARTPKRALGAPLRALRAACRATAQMMHFDFETYLPEDVLTKVDRMSMAHSIESRVPLLDNEVVDFAARCRRRFKIHERPAQAHPQGSRRGRCCPPEILDRRKQGFARPARRLVPRRPARTLLRRAAVAAHARSAATSSRRFVDRLVERARRRPSATTRCGSGRWWSSSSGTASTSTRSARPIAPTTVGRGRRHPDRSRWRHEFLSPSSSTATHPAGRSDRCSSCINRIDRRRFASIRSAFTPKARGSDGSPRLGDPVARLPDPRLPAAPQRRASCCAFARWCREHEIAVAPYLRALLEHLRAPGRCARIGAGPYRQPARFRRTAPDCNGCSASVLLPPRIASSPTRTRPPTGCAPKVCPTRRSVVIPNGIDHRAFEPARYYARTPGRACDDRLPAGREADRRAHFRSTPRILERYPAPSSCSRATGPAAMHCRRAGGELGVGERVRFLGHRDDVPHVLQETDVFVLPSRSEAFPTRSSKRWPPACRSWQSAVGGIPELVRDGATGRLVAAGDPDALASAVTRAARRSGARPKPLAGPGAARSSTTYSFDRMVERVRRALRTGAGRATVTAGARGGRVKRPSRVR